MPLKILEKFNFHPFVNDQLTHFCCVFINRFVFAIDFMNAFNKINLYLINILNKLESQQMNLINQDLDVIVIGAGLAGLKAALELKNAGKKVLVLEARDRVGGRAKRGEICGHAIDHGGQWLGAQQPRLRKQAEALNIKIYSQYTKG